MKAPSADAKRSIADVVNTVVSRFGLRIYASTLPKSTQIGNLSPQTVDLGRLRGYLCVVRKLLLILLLITAPTCAWSAQGGDVSADRPAEYMIYQYPGVSLLAALCLHPLPVFSDVECSHTTRVVYVFSMENNPNNPQKKTQL